MKQVGKLVVRMHVTYRPLLFSPVDSFLYIDINFADERVADVVESSKVRPNRQGRVQFQCIVLHVIGPDIVAELVSTPRVCAVTLLQLLAEAACVYLRPMHVLLIFLVLPDCSA